MRRIYLCLAFAACRHADVWSDGCFVVRDASMVESSHARCSLPRRPYSTFKLANALIAVDAGVLDGPDAPMTWDRVAIADDPTWPDVWRKPHTLRSALAVSALPYFRTLALTLGPDRMRAGLAKLHYGNADMTGGLDLFWLRGGLRISALDQLAFVDGIAHRTLAVSAHAQDVVYAIAERDRTADAVLYGKTGSGPLEDGRPGWLVWQVGWVERGGRVIPYAAWLERHDAKLDDARAALQRTLLDTLAQRGLYDHPR